MQGLPFPDLQGPQLAVKITSGILGQLLWNRQISEGGGKWGKVLIIYTEHILINLFLKHIKIAIKEMCLELVNIVQLFLFQYFLNCLIFGQKTDILGL